MSVPDNIYQDLLIVLLIVLLFMALTIGIARILIHKDLENRPFWILFLFSLLGLVIFIQPILLEDNLAYFSYVRSMFMDGDLNIWNESFLYNSNNIYTYDSRLPLGPTGSSIFYAPFFMGGHVLALILNKMGYFFPLDGFTFPYLFSVTLGGFLCSLCSLFLIYRLCRGYFSENISLCSVLLILFGTNLLMVTYMWTGSSFPPSLLSFSLFLFIWHNTRQNRNIYQWMLMGLTGGIMTQVRFQNGVLMIIPALESMKLIYIMIRAKKWEQLPYLLLCGMAFLACVLIAFSPQLVTWKTLNHSFFIDLYDAGKGRFESPVLQNLAHIFFSPEDDDSFTSGLFVAMPILIPAFAGIFYFFKHDKEFAAYMSIALILQFWVVASYEKWHGNLLFATPYFITCSPFFALGLGAFIQGMWKKRQNLIILNIFISIFIFTALIQNIHCILIQQIFEQVTYYPENISFWQGLHQLIFLPDLKMTGVLEKLSGNFGYFLRSLAHPLTLGKTGMIWKPIVSVFITLTALTGLTGAVTAVYRRFGKYCRTRQAYAAMTSICILILILINGSIVYTASQTESSYDYYIHDEILDSYELIYKKTGPNEPFIFIPVDEDIQSNYLYLITFLTDGSSLLQGESVADVIITDAEGRHENHTMITGRDTADYMIKRPESQGKIMHSFANTKIVHNWLMRDHSDYYYYGHAYLCSIQFPELREIKTVEIRYLADRGHLVLTHLRLYQNGM